VNTGDATAVLARALRTPGDAAVAAAAADTDAIVAAAVDHRVLVLLGAQLRAAGTLHRWPPAFREAFSVAEREAAALECVRRLEFARVLAALDAGGVRNLVFKGAALAITHYAAPHQRPRTDADLLIDAADSAACARALAPLGYQQQHEIAGRLVTHQHHYSRRDRYGVFHALDVHWKISNRHALAGRFRFDELWRDRLALTALGSSATTVSAAHALLLALVHRAGHHPGSSQLLWIYDLHTLASRMTADDRDAVARLAAAKGLSRLAGEGLTVARDTFGTPVDAMIRALREPLTDATPAPVLPDRWRQAGVVGQDLLALNTWRARRRLLREHLFPAPAYIRGKYGVRSSMLLPALYAWRIVAAAPRWLRRHERNGH
jgi:hypothetical protein